MIRVVEKALNILELLSAESERDFALGEIAGILDLDKGTCANIVRTLRERGYVDQVAPRKGYQLGYMAYRLGDSFVNNEELAALAQPVVDRLGQELGESVLLSVVRQDKRVLLYGTTTEHELVVRTSREIPVYRSTTGLMILSYLSGEELVRFVRHYGLPKAGDWEGVESFDALLKELDRARALGWRYDCNKSHVVGLAVPIWKGNKVVASIGVYLPEFRCTSTQPILNALLAAAETLRPLLYPGLYAPPKILPSPTA